MPDQVRIEGGEAIATSPEGKEARMPLAALMDKLAPQSVATEGVILPDGIRATLTRGPIMIWVFEVPPRVHNLRWIAADSPAPFGEGAKYRNVRLALPYLILMAVFGPTERGLLHLTQSNECFFRTAPLKSLDDELLYPALLNCSKFEPQTSRPLSWICTQHVDFGVLARERDLNRRLRESFNALRHCLLETGFNWSSERHELTSWFSESKDVDPRINTVEKWQDASAKDPLFVLEVPWLKTGRSVGQVAERIFKNHHTRIPTIDSAAAIARLVFNHQTAAPQRKYSPMLEELIHALAD